MALLHHGYRRFTEVPDLLVTREGLKVILITADPVIARKYGMKDEAEYWCEDRSREDT